MRSRIEPMKKIARSMREHRGLILNYFRAQKLLSSSAIDEAIAQFSETLRIRPDFAACPSQNSSRFWTF